MRILILNWRDIVNPKSGGAEILTHEMARRWVSLGHSVTQFSSIFPKGLQEETIDGVKIIRRGHPDVRYLFSSVHFLAFRYYKKHFEGKFDVVVDEVHGLPFFTPWYVKEKKIALVCEVANELWVKMFGRVFGTMGKLTEWLYLHFTYQNTQFLTISQSSKDDLIREGINQRNITVLPMGATIPKNLKTYEKEKTPTLIYVGRFSRSKGIEDAIIALQKVLKNFPKTQLWVVGYGEEQYRDHLLNLAKRLEVQDNVTFWGFISEEKKFELLQRASVLVAPSIKEGWGLIVPEAAAMGTPSVVYNSPGLKDVLGGSIFKTIVKSNTPEQLSKEIITLLENKDLDRQLQKKKNEIRIQFDWDKTADAALQILKN